VKLILPERELLQKTNELDYYYWNYQFPIKYIQRFRFKAVLALMHDQIYDKLLEVGTGSGIFLPELSRHCHELYACDIHNRISAIESLSKATRIQVNFKQTSIESSDYLDNMFDAVVAVSVLEFVTDLQRALSKIKRILKTGSHFFTICPQRNKILDTVLSIYSRRPLDEEFINSRMMVNSMLEKYFEVVEKKVFPPIIGKSFPVYYYYDLRK